MAPFAPTDWNGAPRLSYDVVVANCAPVAPAVAGGVVVLDPIHPPAFTAYDVEVVDLHGLRVRPEPAPAIP